MHLASLAIPDLAGAASKKSTDDGLQTAALDVARGLGCESALGLAQAVVRADWADAPRLVFVTRGARGVEINEASPVAPIQLGQAPLWGFGAVLAVEHPELRVALVDLDPAAKPADAAASLAKELAAGDSEQQVAYRGGERFIARLGGYAPPAANKAAPVASSKTTVPSEGSFQLECPQPGSLDRLTLRPCRRRAPERAQVEIEVGAAGLNFSDVLKAMGLYPGLGAGPVPMGIECAGRVSAVGPEVSDLRVGDPVIAIAPFSFASHAITEASAVAPKPEHLSDAEAAAVPIAFLTAHYALHRLAQIEPGERVLIHAAAGGVGLAAVQICQARGCEILGTAGSPAKRDFLRSLGVEHVYDSRSLDFVEQIRAGAAPEGVDVVLNSLPGEAIPASLSLLRGYGRFLEIGKIDIYQNRLLGMYPFQNNLNFSAIDLDRMLRERPALVRSMFLEIVDRFREGVYRPLPSTVFEAGEVVGAFRYMQQRKNIGKVIVSLARAAGKNAAAAAGGAPVRPVALPTVRGDGSYLITGGLGALGLGAARWLARSGAGRLVLMGRGRPTPAAQATIEEIEALGAEVTTVAADVASGKQVLAALAASRSADLPLRGVIHAAGLLDDGAVASLDRERLARALAPKVDGAWNLHVATRGEPLDFFVMFSSVAPLLGSPGQANYAAGNAFLDSLAWERRRTGLPALTINWGPWADGGMATRSADAARLAAQGIAPLPPDLAFQSLRMMLDARADASRRDGYRLEPAGRSVSGRRSHAARRACRAAGPQSHGRLATSRRTARRAGRGSIRAARAISHRAACDGDGNRARKNQSPRFAEHARHRLADGDRAQEQDRRQFGRFAADRQISRRAEPRETLGSSARGAGRRRIDKRVEQAR